MCLLQKASVLRRLEPELGDKALVDQNNVGGQLRVVVPPCLQEPNQVQLFTEVQRWEASTNIYTIPSIT